MRGLLPDSLVVWGSVEFAVLVFFLLFVVIVWRTYSPTRRELYRSISALPLEEGNVAAKTSPVDEARASTATIIPGDRNHE
jgi:cbb3-type cytochrome oxidase subunit 3